MDRQFARYRMRGEASILSGQWQRFKAILMSPQSYYQTLAVEHSSQIDANLSYEVVIDFLAERPEFAFSSGFQGEETSSRQMSRSWSSIRTTDAIASSQFPQLHLIKPDVVGSGIYYPPLFGGNSLRLILKFKGIGCELH
ncbi:hypothetical protein [Rhizobium populisoli]|uniref:hypothetical protein n=1 Tax=Rhizobium populisoli TaxID=2859785 RepID=UPI001FE7100F|nr:hypothetical protein [Rhizobium populisoli]